MNELISVENGNAFTSSKGIADNFGKTHKSVLKAIKVMECSEAFRGHHFAPSSYTSLQNKVLGCYNLTRDGFSFLCMGFTGKEAAHWKERYIDAFNIMESTLLE